MTANDLVSDELNNTVSVCRKYYIHPTILKNLINGDADRFKEKLKRKTTSNWYSTEEKSVIKILKAVESENI